MLIANGGGADRPTVVPTLAPSQQQPANTAESDAAALARDLQRQIEAILEQLREAQRRAEEARKRVIEAQNKAELARKAEEIAKLQAEKTKAPVDEAASKKADQNYKLEDARLKKESADANLRDKDLALLKAQVAQKKDAKKSHAGQASGEANQKVKDAQADRAGAQRTSDLSKRYASSQEKESKAQDAEAKVVKLTPTAGRPESTVTTAERDALATAKTEASSLRTEANDGKTRFTNAVGADLPVAFYGPPPELPTGTVPAPQTTALSSDPLHSPLLQLLQVSPRPSGGPVNSLLFPAFTSTDLKSTQLAPAQTTLNSPYTFSPVKDPVATQAATKTLSAIADGKSVDQIASERGIGAYQLIAEAKAAGVQIESSKPSTDVQQTTIKRGDATLTYTHDTEHGSVTAKGSFADPTVPGGRKTIEASQDGNGRFSQTVKDDKTGVTTTHVIDTKTGTRTEMGSRTETTTELTGATVRRKVDEDEGYLDVAKAAGLTPEQLRALNPDVDYGKPLKPGQELVVSGVRTTVKTSNKDGTSLEETTESNGTRNATAVTADGRRISLMGDPDATKRPGEAIRKGIFEDNKTVLKLAKSLGQTEAQVLAALPPGTVTVTAPTSDNGDVETRTIYDPVTNRTVVETNDWQHDTATGRQMIGEKTVFRVRQFDPGTGKHVIENVAGGLGYAQKQADDKLASVGDHDKQIADLDKTIRLITKMGEPVADLLEQRKQLVSKRDTAKGEADIAQGQATSALIKNQQVKLDKIAANAYQWQFVARPGSDEQKKATQTLKDNLALADKIDRLAKSADKDVALMVVDLDRGQKHGAKVEADENFQTQFQKWKDEVWMWQGISKGVAEKMKAEGQQPNQHIFRNSEEENDAARKALVLRQEFLDKHGEETLTDAERPVRNAWLQRNLAGTAELASNDRYFKVSIDKGTVDAHMIRGDIDRLQARRDGWVKANPKDFSEHWPGVKDQHGGQKALDQLNDDLTKLKVGGRLDGKDQKYNQYLQTLSVIDREDPDKLKEASQKYGEDNAKVIEKVDQQINDLMMAGTRRNAQVSKDYIKQWPKDNPELQAKLDALGQATGTSSMRAAEHRMEQRDKLLTGSHEGRQLKAALAMKGDTQYELTQVADDDVARVQQDLDGISRSVEGQTWLRDVFSDKAEDSQAHTQDQLDQTMQLRDDLVSGKITLTEYTRQQDALMDSYGFKSIDIARELRDSNETWAFVDELARTTVTAVAGIGATLASGGNIPIGISVAVGVNQLWDTSNDLYAASNGRDIYADGHSSLHILVGRTLFDRENITGEQVAFTFKDDAVDVASAAVSATGVGAGMRTSAALTAKAAARQGLTLGPGTTLSLGSRTRVGAWAGAVAQGVDGAGRVGVETLDVGLGGKLGTDEGNQRIRTIFTNSVVSLVIAPGTGGISAAIPMGSNVFSPMLGAQFANDAVGSWVTGDLISLMNDGRHMNQAQFTAASLQAIPGTIINIALHPSRFSRSAENRLIPASPTPPNSANRPQPPAGPDGRPLVPTTLGRGRSWEDVASRTDGYIHRQELANQPGSKVKPLQPSASETAVKTWLTQDPAAGTVFVVTRLGPNDTIYGASSGARARNRDTYDNIADARAAAERQGGAWINRVHPRTDRLPMNARQRVGADEIVGAVHVNGRGDALPIGIPNIRNAAELIDASGMPTWKGGIKGALSSEPGNKKINPMQMLGIGAGMRLSVELTKAVYGVGFGSSLMSGRVASVSPGPLSTFGRIAYLSSSQRGKEAVAAATVGNTAKANQLIGKVIDGTGLRGDKVMDPAKAQTVRDNVRKIGEAGEKVQQARAALGADAPSAKLFRLHTLRSPGEAAAMQMSQYHQGVPGMKGFLKGLQKETGGEFNGKRPSEIRLELLLRLEPMDANQLQLVRDDTADTSPQARLLRELPKVYANFHRTAGERARLRTTDAQVNLRSAHQGLYDKLIGLVGRDGVINLGKAEGLGGSTNSPNTELGKFSRRAVILTNVNLAVGAGFKSRAAGDSLATGFANVADFFTVGTAGMNIVYNLKVEKLATVEAKIDADSTKLNQTSDEFLTTQPARKKELEKALTDKDNWNKYRDYAGITSGLRAYGQGALLTKLDFSALPHGDLIQGTLVAGSFLQGTLTMGWVGLQQYKPLRNGDLPNLTKTLKWTTAAAIVTVPIASQVITAFFPPAGEKKDSLFESWWKMIPKFDTETSSRHGQLPGTVSTVHPGDPRQPDGFARITPEELPQLQPVFATVDSGDPSNRTLSGIAANNVDALFADPALFKLRLKAGPEGASNQALAQLFNLNPQFNRKLMDGEVTNVQGDPDTLINGLQVRVGERWASA